MKDAIMKVSVCMITYNHEKFISEAIEGVINQQTDFEIELIIANDSSPDETDQIVNEYIKNHPRGNIIQYFRHEKNKGMMPNFDFALKQCKGKYVALCEGDDYWTDPLKLQKQVDFLEANADFNICFHQIQILHSNQIKDNWFNPPPKKGYTTIYDLIELGNFITTLSVVFRNTHEPFPHALYVTPIGDYFFYLIIVKDGKIKFIDEVMAVYRSGVGVHSTLTPKQLKWDWHYVLSLINSSFEGELKILTQKKIEEARASIIQHEISEVTVGVLSEKVSFKKLFKACYLAIKSKALR